MYEDDYDLLEILNAETEEKPEATRAKKLSDIAWKIPSAKKLDNQTGKFTIRLFPPEQKEDGTRLLFKQQWTHWYISNFEPLKPNVSRKNLYCFKTFGLPCPTCEVVKKHLAAVGKRKHLFPEKEIKNFYKWSYPQRQLLVGGTILRDSHPHLQNDFKDYKMGVPVIIQLDNENLQTFLKTQAMDLMLRKKTNPAIEHRILNPYVGNAIQISKTGKNVNFQLEYPNGPILPTNEATDELLQSRYIIDDYFTKDENYDKLARDVAAELDDFIQSYFLKDRKPVVDEFKLPDAESFSVNEDLYRQPPEAPMQPQASVQPQQPVQPQAPQQPVQPLQPQNIPPSQRASQPTQSLSPEPPDCFATGVCFTRTGCKTCPFLYDCNSHN